MNKAIVLGNLVLTSVNQACGAPIIDKCGGRTLEGTSWHGRAIHLSPWRKNRYGDREEGKAFCIGLLRKIK
jgi:hypothetical protein